jgi:hypothetical protein
VKVFLATQAPAAISGGLEDLEFDCAAELDLFIAAVGSATALVVAFVDWVTRVEVEGDKAAGAFSLDAFREVRKLLGEADGAAAVYLVVLIRCPLLRVVGDAGFVDWGVLETIALFRVLTPNIATHVWRAL